MFYTALFVAAILLIAINLIAGIAKHPVWPILATTFLFLCGSFLIPFGALPPVALQAILVGIVALMWGASRYRAWFFLASSCFATLIAFAIPTYFALRETKHLQEAFPYISMEDRLSSSKSQRRTRDLPAGTAAELDHVEILIDEKDRMWPSWYRRETLRAIHEDAVQIFMNRSGFGFSRMIRVTEEELMDDAAPLPQPGKPSASPWLSGELSQIHEDTVRRFVDQPGFGSDRMDGVLEELLKQQYLLSLHHESVVDFINPAGFGYMKDRRHVAGFQEHRIGKTPTPERPWKLQTLDLVGLSMHEKPIAYISKDLPRMKELRAAPTRALDEFETTGLFALQHGEELFVRERRSERRMLGAIRAVRQCLSCHDAERGDLLGAFSYRMTQEGQ